MVVKVFCIGASWSFGANAVSCPQWRGADRNPPEDDVDREFYDGLAFPLFVPRNREQQYRRRPPRQRQQQVQIPPQPRHQVRDAYRHHEQIQRRGPARWDQLPNGQLLARVEVELPARPQEQGFQPQQQIQPAIPVQDPALDVSSADSTDSSDSADTDNSEIWPDNDGGHVRVVEAVGGLAFYGRAIPSTVHGQLAAILQESAQQSILRLRKPVCASARRARPR